MMGGFGRKRMTPKFLAYKREWVLDDSTFLYDKDVTRNPGRGAGWGWACAGRVDNESFRTY